MRGAAILLTLGAALATSTAELILTNATTLDAVMAEAAMRANHTRNQNDTVTYAPLNKTDPHEIADGITVYAELYSSDPPDAIRNLRDNTQNTEAVVQSAKPTDSSDQSDSTVNSYPSPITVESPDVQTSESRRLASGSDSPVSVMFCDPASNAIWKWDYYASQKPAANQTAKTSITTKNSTVQTADGVCDARTTIKVSSYQAGCSLQNHPEGCSNVYYKGCGGLTVHPTSKRVVVARTGGRTLGVLDYKSKDSMCQGRTMDVLATFKGRKFNSPSDAEFASNGDLYFTDSPFGLAKSQADLDSGAVDSSPEREIPFNGVYVLKNNSKSVELVDCTMDRPNKIAFSPKQDKLYVTNSQKTDSYVKEFALYENGTIGDPVIFFNFTQHPELETEGGYADGIKVDEEGNVFVVAHKGVYVFSADGVLLVAVRSNVALSGVTLGKDRLFYSGAFGVASQGGVKFSTVRQAVTDCKESK